MSSGSTPVRLVTLAATANGSITEALARDMPSGMHVDVALRRAGELAESAVAVHADHLQSVADVLAPDPAGVACAAADHRIDHHPLADARCGDAFADRIDLPTNSCPITRG